MYVVVRGDLPAADQAVQAAHALADFATEHPKEFKAWNTGNNTLVLLQAHGESHLRVLAIKAEDGGFKHTTFIEPDPKYWGPGSTMKKDTLTAIAFAPDWTVQNVLLADLPLALPMDKKERKRRTPRGSYGPSWAGSSATRSSGLFEITQ